MKTQKSFSIIYCSCTIRIWDCSQITCELSNEGPFTDYVWTVKDKLHYRRHQNLTIGRYILWWKCNCTYVLNMVQVSSYVKIITNLFVGFLERKLLIADWPYIHKTIVEKNLKTRAVFSNRNLKSHKMVGWFYNCVCVCSIFSRSIVLL